MNILRFALMSIICISLVACTNEDTTPEEIVEDILPEQEIQLVGDMEIVVDKEPEDSSDTTETTPDPEPKKPKVETKQETQSAVMTDEEMRDLDAEMDAFLEEILSGIE